MTIGVVRAQSGGAEAARLGPEQIGEQLRAARLERGEHLPDIAHFLRIKPVHLAALEAGDLAALPGQPYALGFLRVYAAHLGLDGDRLAGLLKRGAPPPSPRARSRASAGPADAPVSIGSALPIALLAGAALWLAYGLGAPDRGASGPMLAPSPSSYAPAMPAAATVGQPAALDAGSAVAAEPPALTALAAADSDTMAMPEIGPPSGRVALLARADSWVHVRSQDRSYVRSGRLAADGRLSLPSRSDLLVSAGDGGSIEVILDGRSIGALGPAGTAVRDVVLAPDALVASDAPGR